MLKGHELQFYLDSLKSKSLSFDDLCRSLRQRFEPEERTRALIREWDTVSLPIIIHQNPDKSKTDCLNILVSHLTDIQTALPAIYRPEIILKIKLLNSAKDISECKLAYQKPAQTIHSVISDIQSALATSTTVNPSPSAQSDLLYAERQAHRPKSRTNQNNNNRRIYNYNYSQSRYNNNNGQRFNKLCFVCLKHGCWSTNNTSAEIDRAAQRNHQSRQFVTDIDDDEEPSYDAVDQG